MIYHVHLYLIRNTFWNLISVILSQILDTDEVYPIIKLNVKKSRLNSESLVLKTK